MCLCVELLLVRAAGRSLLPLGKHGCRLAWRPRGLPPTAAALPHASIDLRHPSPAAPQVYPKPLSSFATDMAPAPVATIPVVAEGRAALERINKVRQSRAGVGFCKGQRT